jgi:hypothetical protein
VEEKDAIVGSTGDGLVVTRSGFQAEVWQIDDPRLNHGVLDEFHHSWLFVEATV